MKPSVIFQDWGNISYKKAWDQQQVLLKEVIATKRHNRNLSPQDKDFIAPENYLIFCDHPPVYTLGKSGSFDNLLLTETQLVEKQIEFFKINRGGDITYHGPGQVVGYPIFDLDLFFNDVHKYVRYLEEAVIRMLADYGLEGYREEGYTGVWLKETTDLPKRKICAIGVHLSRWVTMHGFALNVNTELGYFRNIIPCGIEDKDKDVTSMANELGREIDKVSVKANLKKQYQDLFEFDFSNSHN